MVDGLQMARGEMRRAGGDACAALAPEAPRSLCGHEGQPPQDRSLLREDLFCEMLTWQLEELGDGDPAEFERNFCPFDAAAAAEDGDSRKGFAFARRKEASVAVSGAAAIESVIKPLSLIVL